MEAKSFIFFACLTVALFIEGSYGLKCYQCDNCPDPFDATKAKTVTCPTSMTECIKTKASVLGIKQTARACGDPSQIPNGCKEQSMGGAKATACGCTGDLCNGATSSTISITAVLTLVAAVFVYKNVV